MNKNEIFITPILNHPPIRNGVCKLKGVVKNGDNLPTLKDGKNRT